MEVFNNCGANLADTIVLKIGDLGGSSGTTAQHEVSLARGATAVSSLRTTPLEGLRILGERERQKRGRGRGARMATRFGFGLHVVLNDRVSTGAFLVGSSQVLKILAHHTEMSYRLLDIMCQGGGRCSRICYSNRETGGRRVELRCLGAGVF